MDIRLNDLPIEEVEEHYLISDRIYPVSIDTSEQELRVRVPGYVDVPKIAYINAFHITDPLFSLRRWSWLWRESVDNAKIHHAGRHNFFLTGDEIIDLLWQDTNLNIYLTD